MAKIRTLGPGSLVIGEEGSTRNLSADVTNVSLTPNVDQDDPVTYLDGSTEAAEPTITWELSCTVKDDYSVDGLSVWLFDNAGKTLPAVFTPNSGGSVRWKMNVTIAPVAVGGDVKSKPDNDLTLTATDVAHEAIA